LEKGFRQFIGDIKQVPPMVSAVKKDGKRLYELAREGIEVEREAKDITIESIDLNRIELPYADFVVKCSKGTYIRTLCSDVGKVLGCGACLSRLNRIRSGEFDLSESVTIDELKEWDQERLGEYVEGYLHSRIQRMQKFSDF
jgi:tRNA pseudouridine55 synthase